MSDRPVADAQHTQSHTSHSVGLLFMSDRPVAEARHTLRYITLSRTPLHE